MTINAATINAATPAPAAPNVVLLCLVVVLIYFNAWAMWRWRVTLNAWGRALDEWGKANALNITMHEERIAWRCSACRKVEKGSSRS